MNLITNTMQQLMRRRLWPVALLLVAALVAVPMTLAKSPEPAAPAPQVAVASSAAADAAANKPIVELATPSDSSRTRRRVLGQAKDPFAPAPLPKAKKSKKKKAEPTPTPAATEDTGSDNGGASAPGGTVPPTATPAPTVTVPKNTIKVRFGQADESAEALPETYVKRLEPLVSEDTPVLVFERVENGAAVFSIPGDVSAVGDGHCSPNPEDCETLKLRAGQIGRAHV